MTMDKNNKIDLLEDIKNSSKLIKFKDISALDSIVRKLEMIIRNVMGEDSKYLSDLEDISFITYKSSSRADDIVVWESGQEALANLIDTIIAEIQFFDTSPKEVHYQKNLLSMNKLVFVTCPHCLYHSQS